MTPRLRDISSSELKLFADIVHRLQRQRAQDDVLQAVLGDLVTLFRAEEGVPAFSERQMRDFGDQYM